MNILFVLTSHDELGNTGEKTGFWVEEFAAPYYVLADAGVNITLASPAGGQPPIDPKSALEDFQTEDTRRFDQDTELQQKLANTLPLSSVSADDYDAIFYPGGHGPMWDLTQNKTSIALIETFARQGKPVSAVCHAPSVLLNTKDEAGEPLVKNKKVTGFTNTEEAAVGLTEVVPFLLEDELKQRGGVYSQGPDWGPYLVEDGLLITGQNPASSTLVAKAVLARLTK
ncbi:type 1 glutamine amidotransferase domain-containing protein [Amphritea sp. 2_MG-2023]|uniref:type 1 glutamine amidotransferase domain-containing protein n=1 Tax=Amphritea TaxID=515417 RepID=UPI001C06647E|nr:MULTISPECIES: type 1 glutamine amidotransferase domain-containing protein [Amphritea]MBU2966973.1 type 1 glutamine amidotransferase domain-containing protein [Amphritea atlantica]MDO6420339.1 type 1 glutamine amidotransferase domain-containing protein [Amphritea sp. 2_MG-2023]